MQQKNKKENKKKHFVLVLLLFFHFGRLLLLLLLLFEGGGKGGGGRILRHIPCMLVVERKGEKGRTTSLSIRKLLSLSLSLLFNKSTHPSPKLSPQRRRFHILKKQLINLLTTRIQIRLSRPHKLGPINHFMTNIQHNKQNQR